MEQGNRHAPTAKVVGSADPQRSGVVKRRGRPRLPISKEESVQQRRAQIRHAQKTYQKKKDNAISALQEHIVEVETEARAIAERFAKFYDGVKQAGLHKADPELEAMMRKFIGTESTQVSQAADMSAKVDPPGDAHSSPMVLNEPSSGQPFQLHYSTTFGYESQVLEPGIMEAVQPEGNRRSDYRARSLSNASRAANLHGLSNYRQHSISQGLSPMETQLHNVNLTYSFKESTFSRRLHRYCLEYSYRIFSRSESNPETFFRIFRLVACIIDKGKVEPYFLKILQGGKGQRLEIKTLPFYTIGRAATHYSRRDEFGKLGYPPNLRKPKRILGSFPCPSKDLPDYEQKYEDFLSMMGFGGIWFDSHDVEAYLAERGIILDNQASLVPILEPKSPSYLHPEDTAYGSQSLPANSSTNIPLKFNVQRFLDYLLKNMVVLGRAPGFRKTEVDLAIEHATVRGF